jgi:hypothetical protein
MTPRHKIESTESMIHAFSVDAPIDLHRMVLRPAA